jgi:hypothetical protein
MDSSEENTYFNLTQTASKKRTKTAGKAAHSKKMRWLINEEAAQTIKSLCTNRGNNPTACFHTA